MSEYTECKNCNITIHKNARHAGNLCGLCSMFMNTWENDPDGWFEEEN